MTRRLLFLSQRGLLLGALWMGVLAAVAMRSGFASALDASESPEVPEKRRHFAIPSQPLEAALNQYGALTKLPVLYPSELPNGLVSTPVSGIYTPEEALNLMLQGLGIRVEKTAGAQGEVFRLIRPSQADDGQASAPRRLMSAYMAALQAEIIRELCLNSRTAPGAYEAMFQVSMNADGKAASAALFGSTGDARRDAAMIAALRHVHTGPPPAVSVRVPYLFTLRPAQPGAPLPCDDMVESPHE